MQRACGVASGSLSPQIKAGSLLRGDGMRHARNWRYPDWWKEALRQANDWLGCRHDERDDPRYGAANPCRQAGPAGHGAIPIGPCGGCQNITRLWWLDTRPVALDYPNLTPLPPWTKPFASSRIAAITSFVPCPKAYEGGTWDIAKNKSALQGVVPAEPSPATFRRILSPEFIQATAPPDRVPRRREHFCPKLLADSGGGMIPSWDAMSNRHQTCSRPQFETVLHRE